MSEPQIDPRAQIVALRNTYQRTIEAASREPSLFERWIVIATVVDHAEAVKHQVKIATVGGSEELVKPLTEYLEDLKKDDRIHAIAALGGNWSKKAGKSLAKVVFQAGLPATIAAIVGFVLTVTHTIQDVGRSAGGILALVVGAFLLYAARAPGPAFRILWNLGSSVTSTWGSSQHTGLSIVMEALIGVGQRARQLLDAELWPTASSLFPRVTAGRATVQTVRTWTQATAWAIGIVVVVGVVTFGVGFVQGFTSTSVPAPVPTFLVPIPSFSPFPSVLFPSGP